MKRIKVESKGKSLIDSPRFFERDPDVQFQHSPKMSSAPHDKIAFPNGEAETKEREAHTISRKVSNNISSNTAHAY